MPEAEGGAELMGTTATTLASRADQRATACAGTPLAVPQRLPSAAIVLAAVEAVAAVVAVRGSRPLDALAAKWGMAWHGAPTTREMDRRGHRGEPNAVS